MEYHRSLYKSSINDSLLSSPKNRIKKILEVRQNNRNERFQNNRVIIISPTPKKSKPLSQLENFVSVPTPKKIKLNGQVESLNSENNLHQNKENKKTSRHQAFLQRFNAWKKEKLLKAENVKPKLKPFISACSSTTNFTSKTTEQESFAPPNHKFVAPNGLIVPKLKEKRQLRSKDVEININKVVFKDAVKPVLTTNKANINKQIVRSNSDTKVQEMIKRKIVLKSNKTIEPKPALKTPPVKLSPLIEKATKEIKTVKNTKSLFTLNSKNTNFKQQLIKSKEPIPNLKKNDNAKIIPKKDLKTNLADGFSKARVQVKTPLKPSTSVQIKTPLKPTNPPKKKIEPVRTPRKALISKAIDRVPSGPIVKKKENKPVEVHKKNAISKTIKVKNQHINNKDTSSSKFTFFVKPEILVSQVAETPDENPDNQFSSFVTSTHRKDSLKSGTIVAKELSESLISPIEWIPNVKIIRDEKKTNQIPLVNLKRKSVDNANNQQKKSRKSLSKINESKSSSLSKNNKPMLKIDNEILATPLDSSNTDEEINKTPVNLIMTKENTSLNYLSPFVTTSRGKCSVKKELMKRESIYTLERSSPVIDSVEVRRMKETVRYFRKMLDDEIDRVLKRCIDWEIYVKETDPNILEECGNDMIDVAIGQTKLLTSKKLQQFRKLIDDCEKYTLHRYTKTKFSKEDIGKPILPEDLEGFWSMAYLQIEDIDKRFEKLNQWKSNNWTDPEEIIQHTKKTKNKLLTKVSKKKKPTGSSSGIINQLKKLNAEYKKKKLGDENNGNVIILTPSKKSLRKSSIISENPPATPTQLRRSRRLSVISQELIPNEINGTPTRQSLRRRSSKTPIQNKNETPKKKQAGWNYINLLKTPCVGCNGDEFCSPQPRKSILKTPGTLKKNRNVIFSEKLNFKSPEEVKKESNGNRSSGRKSLSANSHKVKERKRSLNLRTRKLMVDPEASILIPRK